MKGWLLDTNVIVELSRPEGARAVKAWAAQQAERTLHLSILTVAEFDKGIAHLPPNDPRRAHFEHARDALIARFGNRLLDVSNAVVRRWGTISGTTKRHTRQSPPVIDTLLAATAIEHGLILATRNIVDVEGSGADLINPWDWT